MATTKNEELYKRLAEMLNRKTILVSGATGLIGSRIVFLLMELNEYENAGISIIALYRTEKKKNTIFRSLLQRDEILFVRCDLKDGHFDLPAADYIVHCAGYSGGTKMHLKDPVEIFDTGIMGTKHLLEYAVNCSCKGFLYVSTYEVYGNASRKEYITEDQACQLDTFTLRDCYAEVKRLCESMLCAYSAKYGMPVFAVRLTSTFGAGVRYDDPRFFAEFARCIIENREIILRSNGETVRSYLDVEDAATGILYILTRGVNCNAYNLTNMKNEISIKDLALKMIEVSNSPIRLRIEKEDNRAALGFREEGRTVMDASKIQSLGWKPVYTLEETISALLASMREARSLKGDNEK